MDIPVVIKQQGSNLPELETDGLRHVLADNGLFLERRSAIMTSCTQISRPRLNLMSHRESLRLHCGRLPRSMQRVMLAFFQQAHRLYGGEAALVLLYHPESRRFRWHCPAQIVEVLVRPDGWIALDRIEFEHPWVLPDGYVHLGDAHLHPYSPEPSAVDLAEDQDGLHIIVGDILKRPSYYVYVVVDRVRFDVPPASFFEELDCAPFQHVPSNWLKRIRVQRVR
jgi:hypothetical protein